jgi:hypothetical protein
MEDLKRSGGGNTDYRLQKKWHTRRKPIKKLGLTLNIFSIPPSTPLHILLFSSFWIPYVVARHISMRGESNCKLLKPIFIDIDKF